MITVSQFTSGAQAGRHKLDDATVGVSELADHVDYYNQSSGQVITLPQ